MGKKWIAMEIDMMVFQMKMMKFMMSHLTEYKNQEQSQNLFVNTQPIHNNLSSMTHMT